MNVKTNTSLLTDPEVIQLADNIIAGATGKPELAGSPVPLAQLQSNRDDGSTSLSDESQAADALTLAASTRGTRMRVLRNAVNRFARYADSVYDGNELQLRALGLDVRSNPAPVTVVDTPQNLQSTPGAQEGTIRLRWQAVRGRDIYEAQCGSGPSGPWQEFYSGTLPRALCENLTPGTEYFFRVRAQIGDTAGPWSDITKRRAP